jgi:hypothetical protein
MITPVIIGSTNSRSIKDRSSSGGFLSYISCSRSINQTKFARSSCDFIYESHCENVYRSHNSLWVDNYMDQEASRIELSPRMLFNNSD